MHVSEDSFFHPSIGVGALVLRDGHGGPRLRDGTCLSIEIRLCQVHSGNYN